MKPPYGSDNYLSLVFRKNGGGVRKIVVKNFASFGLKFLNNFGMLAVIKTGGKEYLVKEEDTLFIEKIDKKTGSTISFDEVLLLVDEKKNKVEVGTPYLKDVKVEAKVLEEGKKKKILVIKYKPKVRYRRKVGHRQPYTKIQITEIIGTK